MLVILIEKGLNNPYCVVHFSMSYRDKVIVMSFPLSNDDVLLLSCEKEIDFGTLPFEALKIIEPLKKSHMKTF